LTGIGIRRFCALTRGKFGLGLQRRGGTTLLALALTLLAATPSVLAADDSGGAHDLVHFRQEIETLKGSEAAERKRVERDEKRIQELEDQLQRLETQNQKLGKTTSTLEINDTKFQSDTDNRLQELQTQVGAKASQGDLESQMSRYLGTHQFTLTGTAAGSFIYDKQTTQNTFSLEFEPLFLYRLNDWILFEGTVEASLPPGSDASFALPVATAQIFLNDYLEINAGIFDQPFGDWLEDQSPFWVNRLITAPLLYGAEPIVPPTDIGVQLRGSTQWGALGQDVDYTTWIANGPSYDSAVPASVVGQTLNPQNNIAVNTNGRAFGGRFRVYPFPLDSALGRLEVGASTYNGKWLDSNWLYSWGLDAAYLYKDLQARAEYAAAYRQLPSGAAPDNRQGWYVQAGYFLQHLPATGISDDLDNVLHRLELVARYSGVNQRAIVASEIATTPAIGFSGSPSIFSPHAREVALGLDYWIEPSIVWQTEFDLELPERGGSLVTFNAAGTPKFNPIDATANDKALLTQLSIGF
jgi:hypothetical protein